MRYLLLVRVQVVMVYLVMVWLVNSVVDGRVGVVGSW